MDEQIKKSIYNFVQKSLDGELPESEAKMLNDYVSCSENAEYYLKCLMLNNILRNKAYFYELSEDNPESIIGFGLEELALYERTAPAIDIPQEKPQRDLIQKVVYSPRERQKGTKFQIVTFVLSAAAVLLFVLFFKYAPPKGGVEVAILSDSINAKWADIETPMQNGTRLITSNKKLMLREGVAELTFDNQAKVTIESPAEFQIIANDRVYLNYGKAYMVVPREAIGFSVYTANAKVIDLGTEFGIYADTHGDTRLYVLKGKTSLIAGNDSNRASIEVTKGSAKQISGVTNEISDCPYNDRLFVRKISSADKFVWRGEKFIGLADIVGGGDGFGKEGSFDVEIDPLTGKLIHEQKSTTRSFAKLHYQVVTELPFVDGVFLVDGSLGDVQIDSGGHSVIFPDTEGSFWSGICNSGQIPFSVGKKVFKHNAVFGATVYGNREEPSIFLHPNLGITFDLEAIRRVHPTLKIEHFETLVGLSETILKYAPMFTEFSEISNPAVDFYVFVDGKRQFLKEKMTVSSGVVSIKIPLNDSMRYLTLVATDGGDTTFFDWLFCGDPRLIVTER